MRLGFGWTLSRHTCDDDYGGGEGGWLLIRDTLAVKVARYRRRLWTLGLLHPLRKRWWVEHGSGLGLILSHQRGTDPNRYRWLWWLEAFIPQMYDDIFNTKPILMVLCEDGSALHNGDMLEVTWTLPLDERRDDAADR